MKELTKNDLIDIAKVIKQETNRLESAKNSLNKDLTIVYSGSLIEQSRIDKLQEYYQKIGREIINMDIEEGHAVFIQKIDKKFIFGDDNANT